MDSENKAALPDTTEGKIEAAKRYKDEGNDFFKQGNYRRARASYGKALAFTRGLPGRPASSSSDPMAQLAANQTKATPFTATQTAEIDELDAIIKTNIATCYLKLEDPSKALDFANEAIELKKDYWKAFLRKGEAWQALKNHEKAIQAFDHASSLLTDESSNAVIQKAKAKSLQALKLEKEKQKKAFANIFEKERAELELESKK